MKKNVLIAALCAGMVLTGCGGTSSSASSDYKSEAAYDGGYARTSNFATADTTADWDYEEAVAEEGPAGGVTDDITETDIVGQESKIIRNADLSMDVADLDKFAVNLKKTIESYKGYMESSSINDYDSDYSEYRYGYFTVRVPAAKLDDFLNIVKEEGTITSKSESAEDVTLQYVDLEAHIDTYEAERDSLMELMGKAESIEDILAIREQLRDINYELDSLNRQLKSMENKVSYSTVNVEAKEGRSVIGTGGSKSFASRIAEKFMEEFADGWEIALNVLIFIITRIPLFAILGVFVFIIVKIVKAISAGNGKREKKQKKKSAAIPQSQQAAANNESQPAAAQQGNAPVKHITSNVTPDDVK